jgi:hypothetical protein
MTKNVTENQTVGVSPSQQEIPQQPTNQPMSLSIGVSSHQEIPQQLPSTHRVEVLPSQQEILQHPTIYQQGEPLPPPQGNPQQPTNQPVQAPVQKINRKCRYGFKCRDKDTTCPFMHPRPMPCRYGMGCRNPNCTFAHRPYQPPRRIYLPPRDNTPVEHAPVESETVNRTPDRASPVGSTYIADLPVLITPPKQKKGKKKSKGPIEDIFSKDKSTVKMLVSNQDEVPDGELGPKPLETNVTSRDTTNIIAGQAKPRKYKKVLDVEKEYFDDDNIWESVVHEERVKAEHAEYNGERGIITNKHDQKEKNKSEGIYSIKGSRNRKY